MRIADYGDYLVSLSDDGLVVEYQSCKYGSVDQIKCSLELDKRGVELPERKVWKYEPSEDNDVHGWEERQAKIDQDTFNAHFNNYQPE